MKRIHFRYVFLLLLLVFVGIGAAGAYILAGGISARDEPGAAEAFIARRLRHFAIPRRVRELTNPVKANPEILAAATAHFADHCASCHGNDGRGSTLLGRGLYPKPPDMTAAATQQLTDGELYYIIENGIRFTGMPAFGEEAGDDPDNESWDLVHFIRHLPQMTDDEMAAMKQLNPKSPEELEKEERIRKFLAGDDSHPSETSHENDHH
jgi:mono/diheme cytochrome c family protein